MEDQSVTDLSYLKEMAMGDETIVIETTEVFIQDAPNSIEDVQTHYANQDWEKLAKTAHKIKPNLAYMGMNRARELIIEIEQQANNEDISPDLGEKIKEFRELCNKAIDELSGKLEALKA